MQDLVNIAVFHPASVSDALMATPVAAVLRRTFPAAKITWFADPQVSKLLLSCCLDIDEMVEVPRKSNILTKIQAVRGLKPDLLIALSPLPAARMLSLFYGTKVLSIDDAPFSPDAAHWVERYISTLAPLNPAVPEKLFPTIVPDALAEEVLPQFDEHEQLDELPLIGLVPGAGLMMSQRAWFSEGWEYLGRHINSWGKYKLVLFGWEEDKSLCDEINQSLNGICINLSGKLSFTDTAVLMKRCRLVVSGDCGLLHLAVSVGTPVLGLYGATAATRRGPYGPLNVVIDQHNRCECAPAATCHNFGVPGPGECMHKIMLEEVIARLNSVLKQQ